MLILEEVSTKLYLHPAATIPAHTDACVQEPFIAVQSLVVFTDDETELDYDRAVAAVYLLGIVGNEFVGTGNETKEEFEQVGVSQRVRWVCIAQKSQVVGCTESTGACVSTVGQVGVCSTEITGGCVTESTVGQVGVCSTESTGGCVTESTVGQVGVYSIEITSASQLESTCSGCTESTGGCVTESTVCVPGAQKAQVRECHRDYSVWVRWVCLCTVCVCTESTGGVSQRVHCVGQVGV